MLPESSGDSWTLERTTHAETESWTWAALNDTDAATGLDSGGATVTTSGGPGHTQTGGPDKTSPPDAIDETVTAAGPAGSSTAGLDSGGPDPEATSPPDAIDETGAGSSAAATTAGAGHTQPETGGPDNSETGTGGIDETASTSSTGLCYS